MFSARWRTARLLGTKFRRRNTPWSLPSSSPAPSSSSSALSSLFYHWGILQRVVRAVAWVMRKGMRTSGSETLSAAANIFMGQTEAPLVIRPYVPRMTRSEMMTIMVCGMAHIAGGVAAVYAAMGMAAGYPNTAGHLLTASVLNCPAALLIAKIMLPETEAKRNRRHLARHRAAHDGQFH